jgi:hypothetical protein
MPDQYSINSFSRYLGIPEKERVSQDAMNAIAAKVREMLLAYKEP